MRAYCFLLLLGIDIINGAGGWIVVILYFFNFCDLCAQLGEVPGVNF